MPTETLVVASPRTGEPCRRVLSDLAARYQSLRLLDEGARSGFAGALNLGIRQAGSNRIGFLLSDDWLEPGAVASCLRHATNIVSTGLTLYRQEGTDLRRLRHPVLTQEAFERLPSLEAKARHLEHFFLFDRQILLDVGGVDEAIGLVGPDDYDLIWTLLEHGASVTVVEDRLYNYRDHDGDRLSLRSYDEKRADLEKILDKHGVGGAERRQILGGQETQHFARDTTAKGGKPS